MKLTSIVLFVACLNATANGFGQYVTISKTNAPLEKILKEIKRQTGYTFVSAKERLQKASPVTINVTNVPLKQVLDVCFLNQPFDYTIINQIIVVVDKQQTPTLKNEAPAPPPITVHGKVTDEKGESLVGASVQEKGTNNLTSTKEDGNFAITVTDNRAILVVSFVGYDSKEIAVNSQTNISVSLAVTNSSLNDVVVVGYGTQRKINVSGAVSQVSGQVLEDRPITNLGAGLQGLVPSLQITPQGGAPGQGSNFLVRGQTSLNASGPLVLVDGVVQDPNLINPNDVASVTVLKDAAASAIYGGRAAFGVILITTKTGKKNEKPSLNLTSSYSSTRYTLVPKYMNSLDYINYMDTASKNAGAGPYFSQRIRDGVTAYFNDPVKNQPVIYDPAIDQGYYQYVGNEDWTKVYKPAYLLQNNLSLSGGGNNVSYYFSYGIMHQDGLLRTTDDKYQRQNFNLSVNTDVLKWLSFNSKIRYTYGTESHPGGGFSGSGGAYNGQLNGDLRPIMPIRHPDGNFAGQGNFTNPFALGTIGGGLKVKTSDLWLTGAMQLKPLNGLNINADYTFNPYSNNIDFSTKTYREYHADGSYNLFTWTNPSRERQTNSNDYYYAFNAYADYSKTLNNVHNFKLLAGYNQEQKFNNSFNAERQNLVINDQPYLGLATGTMTVGQTATSWGIRGIFGRLNYDFDKKYFLELNTRLDGSSKFPKGKRDAVLPSASVAWRISREKFWSTALNKIIPELKLRGSYGVLGNQNVNSNFPYISTFGVNSALGYIIGTGSSLPVSVSPGGLISPNFTWEKVYQWNVGLDAELLRNQLELSLDLFERSTKGMLVAGTPLPAVLGTAVPQSNAADLKTNGYEIALKWHDKIGQSFSYHADLIFSDAIGTITKFSNPTKDLGGSRNNNYVGRKQGEIWGYVADGLFQSADEISKHPNQSQLYNGVWNPGDVIYKDLNGDGIVGPGRNTVDSSGDQKIIGNTTPRYQYSLVTGAQWKTFELDIILQGIGKRDYFPEGRFFGIGNEFDVPMRAASDFWTYQNKDAFLPKPYINGTHGNRATNTRYLQSAAYLRVKQVTLGYSLPERWASKISASRLRVYATGQNLLTFTKLSKLYDPENLGFGYPLTKAYSFGINLTFK